jgi:methyltransferase-like protein/cyclopropane fatty-acyl-phospholipid synthase-like methyltransferase
MPTIYDEFPYPGSAFALTHPDHLATLAILFGMTPAPADQCRVLELGCGDGANVIPMAFALPKSCFTGIDLASSAISLGQKLIDELHLTNIRLQQLNVMDLAADLGEFDYIIAHGLYSWVPPEVRERILDISKSQLAPNGVVFISYNAYPGGHLRQTLREMMLFHTRNVTGAHERVKGARELLEFLVQSHPEQDAYSTFLRFEVEALLERKPECFYHDELEEHNYRFYFHEFVADAVCHGLQYLSEARLLSTQSGVYPPETAAKINALSQDDDILREQYLDFLKLRTFRQTLLCHAGIKLNRSPEPERVARLSASSPARPSSAEPDVRSTAAEEFNFPKGGKMSTNHPLAKAAILHLGRIWPQAEPFPALLRTARNMSGRDDPTAGAPVAEDANWLSDMLLRLFAADFLELCVYAPKFVSTVSDRPAASPLVHAQVRAGLSITNLRHASIALDDEAAGHLLLMLDGTRDRRQLLAEIRSHVAAGEVDPVQLERKLQELARMAVLIA